MLLLFSCFFFASILFLIFFLMNLPDDIKKESLRPLFTIVPTLGFWIFTLPALLSPEQSLSITTGTTITTVASSALPIGVYNSFFYAWLVMLTLILFLIFLWYVLLLREKTRRLLKEGSGAIGSFEKHFGK